MNYVLKLRLKCHKHLNYCLNRIIIADISGSTASVILKCNRQQGEPHVFKKLVKNHGSFDYPSSVASKHKLSYPAYMHSYKQGAWMIVLVVH